MERETVSVVIPAYRAAATIRRAIDSVLAQTHPAAQIIVVDDGSPDDTAAVVEQTYGDKIILIRQANGKTAKARNTGLDRATGDFIAFLDADDYWEPQKLQRQLAVFEKHPQVQLVAGAWYEERPGEPRYLDSRASAGAEFDRVIVGKESPAFSIGVKIWTGTLLVRREAIQNQRFESGLEPAEDRDLWVRLVADRAVFLISEPLATAVQTSGS